MNRDNLITAEFVGQFAGGEHVIWVQIPAPLCYLCFLLFKFCESVTAFKWSVRMAANPDLKSLKSAILLLVLVSLAGLETTTAQQPAAKPAEPATVEDAMRILDLRTFPLIDGGKVTFRSLGMLMYSAQVTPKEAFEFQRRELTNRGF